jgi:hypothetical protein
MGKQIKSHPSLFQNKRKEKLVAFNLDSLWKHGGMKKAIIAIPSGCKIEISI